MRAELLHEGIDIHVAIVHLPAINTPQFEWVLSRLDRRAQPVPPIFAPEVAAAAIEWASRHRKRELVVGWPTFKTIWGNRFGPAIAERILARSGYEDQQTDEPEPPDRPANLWQPVPGDFSARGRFSSRQLDRTRWTPLGRRPWLLVAALALVFLGLLVAAGALGWWLGATRGGGGG